MSNLPDTVDSPASATISDEDMALLERVIAGGDLSQLNARDRLNWYIARCKSCQLNPFSQPFDYLRLSGKLVLYANKGATEQLCQKHRLTLQIVKQDRMQDLFIVTARVTDPGGRYTEDVGAVAIAGLGGVDLANAMMKAVTKAKRRAVLSLCGLGMMDESEAADLPGGGMASVNPATGEVIDPGSVCAPLPIQPEMEAAALANANKFFHATARDAGIDTTDRPGMRRLAGAVLGREVETVKDVDAADLATVAYWIRENPEAARTLAKGEPTPEQQVAEVLETPASPEAEDEAKRELRLGAVQAAERGPYAQQMGI